MRDVPARMAALAFALAVVAAADAGWASRDATVVALPGEEVALDGPGSDPRFAAPAGVRFEAGAVTPDAWLGRPRWHGRLVVGAEAAPGAAALVVTTDGGRAEVPLWIAADAADARAHDASLLGRTTGAPAAAVGLGALLVGMLCSAVVVWRGNAEAGAMAARGEAPVLAVRHVGAASRVAFVGLPVAAGEELALVGAGAALAARVVAFEDGAAWAELDRLADGAALARATVQRVRIDSRS